MSDIERFHQEQVAALEAEIADLRLQVAKWKYVAEGNDKRYVVLHTHPEGLVMSQMQRDQLFWTGRVLEVRECNLFSLQFEMVKHVPRRPLVVVLWGMSDRYAVAPPMGIEVIEVKDFHSAYMVCQDCRAREETKEVDGIVLRSTVWERLP